MPSRLDLEGQRPPAADASAHFAVYHEAIRPEAVSPGSRAMQDDGRRLAHETHDPRAASRPEPESPIATSGPAPSRSPKSRAARHHPTTTRLTHNPHPPDQDRIFGGPGQLPKRGADEWADLPVERLPADSRGFAQLPLLAVVATLAALIATAPTLLG